MGDLASCATSSSCLCHMSPNTLSCHIDFYIFGIFKLSPRCLQCSFIKPYRIAKVIELVKIWQIHIVFQPQNENNWTNHIMFVEEPWKWNKKIETTKHSRASRKILGIWIYMHLAIKTSLERPKSVEKWWRNRWNTLEIHLISMIFMKLVISHSILHQKLYS